MYLCIYKCLFLYIIRWHFLKIGFCNYYVVSENFIEIHLNHPVLALFPALKIFYPRLAVTEYPGVRRGLCQILCLLFRNYQSAHEIIIEAFSNPQNQLCLFQ